MCRCAHDLGVVLACELHEPELALEGNEHAVNRMADSVLRTVDEVRLEDDALRDGELGRPLSDGHMQDALLADGTEINRRVRMGFVIGSEDFRAF